MTTRDYIVAYHGTAEADVPSILRDGLVPQHGGGGDQWALEHGKPIDVQSRPPSVFVSRDRIFATEFAALAAEETNTAPVVLKLHIPKDYFALQFVEDELSSPKPRNPLEELIGGGVIVNYRSEQPIPPAWIVGRVSTSHAGYHLEVPRKDSVGVLQHV